MARDIERYQRVLAFEPSTHLRPVLFRNQYGHEKRKKEKENDCNRKLKNNPVVWESISIHISM